MRCWLILMTILATGGEAKVPPRKITIIHVADWRLIPQDDFAAELGKQYENHLADIEELQREQVEMLRELSKAHGLKRIFYEGISDEDLKACRESNARIQRLEIAEAEIEDLETNPLREPVKKALAELRDSLREQSIQLGAIGCLIRAGEIEDYIPLEDAKILGNADPEALEDEMAKRLLASRRVAVVVLGGGHDLTDNLAKLSKSTDYRIVRTPKYLSLDRGGK